MPINSARPERDELISELGQSASKEYKDLLDEQKRLIELLKREEVKKNNNKFYVAQLKKMLSDVNAVMAEQNEALGKFYDEFMQRIGEGKNIDSKMLKDLADYQNYHVKIVRDISDQWQTRREVQKELDELRESLYVDGKRGGQIKSGLSQEDVNKLLEEEQAKEELIAQISDVIANQNQTKRSLRDKLRQAYGNGSYVDLAAGEFARNKAKQNEWLERQAKLEEFCLERELDYNKALREGNALHEKRSQMLKRLEKGWDLVKQHIRKSADYWITYNHQSISDAKKLGITSRESAQAYNAALMESSKQLSRNFGITRDQVIKIQETYIQATGKAIIATQSQMDDFAAASSLMGEQNITAAISGIDQLGGTTEQAMELMDKNYAKAVNTGLNAVKASETLVKNLALANQFAFRDGVDGLMRMSIESQRIKLNVAEMGKVANTFSTIEGAIQGSAKLQMLGGYGAMFGGNPMQMMYEALSDPEALYERMGKMFSQQARFDRSKGVSVIDPLQLQIIKEQAKAMGMDENEAVQTAKQQAKLRAIDEDWKKGNINLFNSANAEQRAAIENKAQFSKESGWTVSYIDQEGLRQTKAVNALTAEDMKAIQKDNIEPVEDIRGEVRKIAQVMVSFKDRKQSLLDMFWTSNAQGINGPMKFIDNTMTQGAQGKGLAGVIANVFSTPVLSNVLGIVTAGALGYGQYKLGNAVKGLITGSTESGSVARTSGAGGTVKPAPTGTPKGGGSASGRGLGRVRLGGNLGRIARVGGSIVAIGAGAIEGYNAWQEADENYQHDLGWANNIQNTKEREQSQIYLENKQSREHAGAVGKGVGVASGAIAGGALGATIGSVVPVIGTAVGAAVGAVAGGIYGGIYGNKVGKKMASEDHTKDDEINRELEAIEKGDEEDNFKKIVLPVESIDYNVALIAQRLGVMSTGSARNNVYAKVLGPVETATFETVNPTPNNNNGAPRTVGGNVNLNVNGSIELKMNGTNLGSIKPSDITRMIQNDPNIKRAIVNLILESNARAGINKKVGDNINNQQGVLSQNRR